LDKADYDVVILHAHSVFNFRFIKAPYLVVAHNTKSRQLLSNRNQLKDLMLKKIYKNVYKDKQLAAVSEGIKDDLVSVFGLDSNLIDSIPNPLEIDVIRKLAEEEPDNNLQISGYVIALGRNDPQKRFDRLIRVYHKAEIKEQLVILGRANEDKGLLSLVDELGVRDKVIFLGFKSNPYPYIKNAKCLLMTSDYEGFGMVLVEALALDTPVISTDCPNGPREILGNQFGEWLVPLDNEQEFADKLRALSDSPYKIPSDFVNKYDRAVIAKEYIAAINERVLG
jgi:glycosyltransferase involved in cell wall biosynthesis